MSYMCIYVCVSSCAFSIEKMKKIYEIQVIQTGVAMILNGAGSFFQITLPFDLFYLESAGVTWPHVHALCPANCGRASYTSEHLRPLVKVLRFFG